MPYDYIRRTYGVDPQVGQHVTMEGRKGKIAPVEGDPQYVDVLFEDRDHAVPVHPTDLEYLPLQ